MIDDEMPAAAAPDLAAGAPAVDRLAALLDMLPPAERLVLISTACATLPTPEVLVALLLTLPIDDRLNIARRAGVPIAEPEPLPRPDLRERQRRAVANAPASELRLMAKLSTGAPTPQHDAQERTPGRLRPAGFPKSGSVSV